MAPSLALAFIFAGAALWFLSEKHEASNRRWIARVCWLMVLSIGLVTVAEYVLNWNGPLDQILISWLEPEARERFPGRPAFNAGIGLVLTGAALFGLDRKEEKGFSFSQNFAVMLGFLVIIVLAGYAFGTVPLVSFPTTRTMKGGDMALHAALAFLFLSIGIMSARPTQGVMRMITSETIGALRCGIS